MKKILYLLIITIFTVNVSFAQENDSTARETVPMNVMPMFPGGEIALFKFIDNNITYPTEAKKAKISGFIYISFIIEKDGSLSNIKQADGSIDIGYGCLEEAIRVVKSMPKWTPGKQNGEAVRVSYVLPISFIYSKKKKKK